MPLEFSKETIERLRIPTRKIVDKNQEENRRSNQIRPPSGGFLMGAYYEKTISTKRSNRA